MINKQEFLVSQSKTLAAAPGGICCDILSFEPDHLEEKALGNIYFLNQQTLADKDYCSIPNLINSNLKRTFYKKPELGTEAALKETLKETNKLIEDLYDKKQGKFLNNLFYAIITLKDKELNLVLSGDTPAYFFREKLINLKEKMVPPPGQRLPEKFFQSSLTFSLENQDRLIVATPILQELINQKGLAQIMKEENFGQAAEKINKIIRQQKEPRPLAALFIEYLEEELEPQPESKNYITPPINLREILT